MALQSTYAQFLAAPNTSFLAENASLHYITTLTTFSGASAIIKHLNSQIHELKKNEEKILDAVEGANSLALEIHTTIEFQTGGGAFLPSLDDNFLADRIVTFPIIHIVTFDTDGKILQIRQNWDQGSLLKLIDVIGKSGRNWPIRDGKDQIKLIVSSVKLSGKSINGPNDGESLARARGNSNNVTRDPHASLSLFGPRPTNNTYDNVVAPRASAAKPPPREYKELFVGNDSDGSEPSPTKATHRERSQSPAKAMAKGGAGKHYAPSRIFDADIEEEVEPQRERDHSADHFYKPNPKKYEHFNLADGGQEGHGNPSQTPLKGVKSAKHSSQWNFDDFNTPAKVIPTKFLRNNNDAKHWGNDDDEVMDSPIKAKKVDQPRPDTQTHFEFVDDGGEANGERRVIGRPRGAGQNDGLGLYENNLYEDENGGPRREEKKGVRTIANVKDRRKDFDSQISMTDDSPVSKTFPKRIDENRAKAVKMMDANWVASDQSPSQKENNGPASPSTSRPTNKGPLSEATNLPHRGDQPKGINIAGDGMGSKKSTSSEVAKPKGINIGGDGMGGMKGAGRQWGFGDDSDGEEVSKPEKYKTGKTQGKAQATGGDFWDF